MEIKEGISVELWRNDLYPVSDPRPPRPDQHQNANGLWDGRE